MVTEIRIYFEGDSALKPGFDEFLGEIKELASSRRCRFRLIDANGTPAADFRDALRSNPAAWNVLLLDSEEAISGPLSEFCRKKGLPNLSDQIFWMAQNYGILVPRRSGISQEVLRRWIWRKRSAEQSAC